MVDIMNDVFTRYAYNIAEAGEKACNIMCYVTDNTEHSYESENPITTRHKIGVKQNTLR